MLKGLEVDCSEIPRLMSVEEIVTINRLITDPDSLEGSSGSDNEEGLPRVEVGGPEFDIDREEDYHQLGSPGILETLMDTMLPYECREDSDVLRLTSVIMAEIAQNQAFYEGNKRTAYMAGTVFLIKCQLLENDEAVYPRLDTELTDRLSDLAIDNSCKEGLSREKFYEYLKERLCG